jgi:hypothetical protein
MSNELPEITEPDIQPIESTSPPKSNPETGIIDQTKKAALDTISDPLAIETANIKLEIDQDLVRKFLVEAGKLTPEEAAKIKIEFVPQKEAGLFKVGQLIWSNRVTLGLAKYIPIYRIKEIFTRTQTIEGSTVKLFVNNIEAMCTPGNIDQFTQDLAHHLMHIAQRIRHRRGNPILSTAKRALYHWPAHQLSRLPGLHKLSGAEQEARNVPQKETFTPYLKMVRFSRKDGKTSLSADGLLPEV